MRCFGSGGRRRRPRRAFSAIPCGSVLAVVLLVAVLIEPVAPLSASTSILFVGDSLTLGLSAVDQEHSYESLLLNRLKQEYRVDWARSVIEHPYGLTDNAELRASPYVGAHPQTILVEVGTHEVHAPEAEQARFADRFAHLLDRLAETHGRIIVGTVPWLGYQQGAEDYREALHLNQVIRQEAGQRGMIVADLWGPTVGDAAVLSRPNDTTFMPPFQGDFFHPGNYGHQVLARAFWPALDRVEQRETERSPSGPVPTALPVSVLGHEAKDEAE